MSAHNDLKALFFEAVDLPSVERPGFFAALVRRDEGLGREVERMVAAHDCAEKLSEAAQGGLTGELAGGLQLPVSLGNYELLEYIAEGGSGVVYRARQIDLNRTVAMKLLRSGLLASGEEVQRFRVEAEVSALLDHPSIVPVYEIGNHEGRYFISMKLIEGSSLDQCTEKYFGDPRAAADLVVQVARALDHGHRHGVLHRDIKPSNILVDQSDIPYIADFGTAKLIDEARRQTVSGRIVGTPSYMAPEQSRGEVVTVATDVYSLGGVLYELLAGRPPVVASGLIETLRHVNEEAPTAVRTLRPEIDRDLETICHKCLAKEPHRRYGSSLALAEDLERWLAYEPIQARRATRAERIQLAWRRSPLVTSLVVAVAILALALVVGTVLASFELQSSLEETQEAKQFAREQLRNAYLAEARALRHGGTAGRREEALELLGLAASIRPGRDLLDEGASTLALSDIATKSSWATSGEDQTIACFDGRFERCFVGRRNGDLEVRDALDGTLLFNLESTGHAAWRARFSADGRYLGLVHHARSGSQGDRTVIWDLQGRTRVMDEPRVPKGHFDFAPGRAAAALCWSDGRLFEFDLEARTERTLAHFDPKDPPIAIRYSGAGDRIAVACRDAHSVGIYSAQGQLLTELTDHDAQAITLSWSHDATRLLAGCRDHCAYVWEVDSGERLATLVGHQAEVAGSAFPRPDVAATSSWDGTTRLWDLRTGETLAMTDEALVESPACHDRLGLQTPERVRACTIVHRGILRELRGHGQKDPSSISLGATDGVISSGGKTEVLLWDFASGDQLDQLSVESFLDQLMLPDGSLLVASEEHLHRWSIEGRQIQSQPEALHRDYTRRLAASQDGQRIAFLTTDHLHLMNLGDRRAMQKIRVPRGTDSLAVSPNGELVAAGSYRGSGVRVWSWASGEELVHLAAEETSCTPQFSPDGRHLAYGTPLDYHIHRVDTWERSHSTPRRASAPGAAKVTCYSPDGELLAGTYGRSKLMLMDASTGDPVLVFEPPGRQIFSMGRFTPDGQELVVASESNRILIWDLDQLREGLSDAGLDAELGPGWTRPVGQ